jgi:lytic cellulose monooxygenase (C4-dehydrogenating)
VCQCCLSGPTGTCSRTRRWQLVTRTVKIAPNGTYQASVDAGSRTGRHVVYTVWQASHLDQSYYLCSDVIFSGQ